MVSLPAELAQAVEDYRFNRRVKTEAEAIRRLIEAGLRSEEEVPISDLRSLGTSPRDAAGKPSVPSLKTGVAPRGTKRAR